MTKITPAAKNALRAIYQAGSGVLQRQRVLAAGDWLPFAGSTFLQLVGAGMLKMEGNRLSCTEAGTAMAEKLKPFVLEDYP